MAGNLLHGVTEDMHHLASSTRAIGDSINSNTSSLSGQLDAGLRSGFMGAGGNAFFEGHGQWDHRTRLQIALAYQNQGDTVSRGTQQYETTDLDAHAQLTGVSPFGGGSIASAINPA